MARIHLFEFEDQPWFPKFLRNYGTDFLRFLANKTAMFKPVVPMLANALNHNHLNHIIDLGSGGGGGLLGISEALRDIVPGFKITLTDYYPNLEAFRNMASQSSVINYIDKPIDALYVPENIGGVRTMFLSFHHFRPQQAKQILQNAVDTNKPIAIFEGQERSLPSILAMLFSPVTVLLTTPFIRPVDIGRLIFTYLIPIVPLFVLWDGVVSALRTYSVKEMNALVGKVKDSETYDWKIGKMKSGPSVVLYLVGEPKVS